MPADRAVAVVLPGLTVPLVRLSPRTLVALAVVVPARLKSLYTAEERLSALPAAPLLPTACLLLTGIPPLELTSLREAKAVRVFTGFLGVLI